MRLQDLDIEVVVGYLGNMNPQDGVDHFLEMARIIRLEKGRDDIGFVMVGEGDSFEKLKRLRGEWGLEQAVLMTGRIPWNELLCTLMATDICVQPDPPGKLNDHSTMNKLMEYMALGKAVVCYDLLESRVSGGDAVTYVTDPNPHSLAESVIDLANDSQGRDTLGRAGRARVEQVLAWHHQADAFREIYERMFPGSLHSRQLEGAGESTNQ